MAKNTDTNSLKNKKYTSVVKEVLENSAPIDAVDFDSMGKDGKNPVDEIEQQREQKKKTKKKSSQSNKRGRPKGSTSKRSASNIQKQRAKRKSQRKSRQEPNLTPSSKRYESKQKRKIIPTSLLNFLIFAAIIGAITGAHFLLKNKDSAEQKVVVAPIEITAEEKIENSPPKIVSNDKTTKENITQDPAAEEEISATAADESVEKSELTAKEVSEAVKSKENMVVGIKTAETTNQKSPVNTGDPTPHVSQPYTNTKNPWNSGGPLDLDRPEAKKVYEKQTGIIKVPETGSYSPTPLTPMTSRRSYYDPTPHVDRPYTNTKNPWNSGGPLDLDRPEAKKTYEKQTGIVKCKTYDTTSQPN